MAIVTSVTLNDVGVHDGHTVMTWGYSFSDSDSGAVLDTGTETVKHPGVGRTILLECHQVFMEKVVQRYNDLDAFYSSAAYEALDDLEGWTVTHAGGAKWNYTHPTLCPDGFQATLAMWNNYPTLQSMVLALADAPEPPEPEEE